MAAVRHITISANVRVNTMSFAEDFTRFFVCAGRLFPASAFPRTHRAHSDIPKAQVQFGQPF